VPDGLLITVITVPRGNPDSFERPDAVER